MIRPMRPEDLPAVRELHRRTQYEFALPEKLEAAQVMEEDGRIIGMAGAELCAHVFVVLDPDWGSPHQKMALIESFHWPIAQELFSKGVQYAFTFVEPKFRRYLRRLQTLGWAKRIWTCLSLSQAEVATRLRKAA
jgi:hypothetical protein